MQKKRLKFRCLKHGSEEPGDNGYYQPGKIYWVDQLNALLFIGTGAAMLVPDEAGEVRNAA